MRKIFGQQVTLAVSHKVTDQTGGNLVRASMRRTCQVLQEDQGHTQGQGKLVLVQAMKAYRGNRGIALLLNLDTRWG